jgi:uncharacterized damage-inducible protein DinB
LASPKLFLCALCISGIKIAAQRTVVHLAFLLVYVGDVVAHFIIPFFNAIGQAPLFAAGILVLAIGSALCRRSAFIFLLHIVSFYFIDAESNQRIMPTCLFCYGAWHFEKVAFKFQSQRCCIQSAPAYIYAMKQPTEYWLRGPVPGIPPLLQPVAHALLQAGSEVATLMQDFDDALLWKKPAGVASAGFHLQHLRGVLDRLFTYANGASLTDLQLQQLAAEGKEDLSLSSEKLVQLVQQQIEQALSQLRTTEEAILTDVRLVGRAKLPSTVLGLLVHAAEHTMRHTGQLFVTVQVLRAGSTTDGV